jgi:hypothetical protein
MLKLTSNFGKNDLINIDGSIISLEGHLRDFQSHEPEITKQVFDAINSKKFTQSTLSTALLDGTPCNIYSIQAREWLLGRLEMKVKTLVNVHFSFTTTSIVEENREVEAEGEETESNEVEKVKGIEGENIVKSNLRKSDIIEFPQESEKKTKVIDFLSDLENSDWFDSLVESYLINRFFKNGGTASWYTAANEGFEYEVLREGQEDWLPVTMTVFAKYKSYLSYTFQPEKKTADIQTSQDLEKDQFDNITRSSLDEIRQTLV